MGKRETTSDTISDLNEGLLDHFVFLLGKAREIVLFELVRNDFSGATTKRQIAFSTCLSGFRIDCALIILDTLEGLHVVSLLDPRR